MQGYVCHLTDQASSCQANEHDNSDFSENLAGSRITEADSQYGTEAHLPHSRRRAVQEVNIAVYCILGIY